MKPISRAGMVMPALNSVLCADPAPRSACAHRRSGRKLRSLVLLSSVAAPAALWSSAASAQASSSTVNPTPDAALLPTTPSEQITVTGYRFLDANTSGITNLPLPVQDVPQSVSILNNDFVKAADLRTNAEIAQYTPGALFASYSPSYGTQLWLRGFAANWAIDGLLVGDQITEPDPAILQRYEVVKGPASVVYGAQGPGGVVNLVSKDAAPGTPSYVEALGGSWGRWRLEGQLAGAINDTGTIRGVAVVAHEEGGGFVDDVNLNKTVLYGDVDFDIADGLRGYIRASYQETEDTPYNGIPSFPDGYPVPVSRSYFLGASNLTNTTEAERFNAGLTWRPDDLWSVDLKGVYQHTSHDGGNVYPYSTIGYDGSFPVGGEHFNNWHVSDGTVAATAIRRLDDIGLAGSSLEASARYQHYEYFIAEQNLTGGTANIFAGENAVSDIFNALQTVPGGYEQDQFENFFTSSVQAVIKPVRPLTFVGGISYSRPDISQQVYEGPFQGYNPGDQVDLRGAVIVEPVKDLNFYVSYDESYQPNLRIDVTHAVLPPVQGRQVEIGAKYLVNRRLLLTAAVFDINEGDVAVFDQMVNGEALYRAEGVRHRGLEAEATGQITDRWQIKAGTALLDPRVTNDPEHPIDNGEVRPWLPRVTADLYTIYALPYGLSVGGGMRFVGDVKTYDTVSAPTHTIPAYVVFDASLGYTYKTWHLQFNAKNVFDEHYYVSTPVFQSLTSGFYPGEPASYTVSLRKDF